MQLHKAFSSCLIAICVGLTLTATTLKRVDVSEKGFVVIRDGVLNLETLESLSQLLLNHASWRYVGEGEYGFHKNGQPLREQGRYFKSGWPWLANLNTARLRGTTLGRDLVDIVAELSGRSNYTLEAATGILLRRGDEPRMTGGLDQSEDNAGTPHNHDIAVNVFIELTAKRWLKNDYGETLFYYPVSAETGSGMREVLTAVHLKHGRIVVWTDDVPFTLRPPSMNYEQARCGVLLRFGSDNKLASEEGKSVDEETVSRSTAKSSTGDIESALRPEQIKEGLQKKLTMTFTNAERKDVSVFDDVVTAEQLTNLHEFLYSPPPAFQYQFADSMVEERPATDASGIPWAAQYSVASFTTTTAWATLEGLASIVAEQDGWYPRTVSLKALRSGDWTQIHSDCAGDEEDYTLVIHLDEHYNQSSQGEMVFFDQKEVVGRPRSHYSRELNKDDEEELEEDEYGEQGTSPRLVHDAIGAVQPRTGRVVVFHCSVVHSFRPPRSDFKGVRTMLVVKTSSSEQAAKARILTQTVTGSGSSRPVDDLTNSNVKEGDSQSTDTLSSLLAEEEKHMALSRSRAMEALYSRL